MKNIINIKENHNNSTSNKDIMTSSVISVTLHSEELYNGETENTCEFKVNEDGKIIVNCNITENYIEGVSAPIQEVTGKIECSLKTDNVIDMLENLPEDLSKNEISKIVGFLNINGLKEIDGSRIFPYSVKLTDNDDVMVTLLVYNGGTLLLDLPQIPLKLIDGNKSVIIADLIDVNLVVNSDKIGVFEIILNKEKLKKNTINLDDWCISFSL